ncbi:hypothetical protein L596_005209 [Steinernema carpocapsae]|uniref:Serpentine receptor class gamma n=1 Tax=Steinernema carpocapsae TaxID=34508 RepID=A0A4V6I8L0_STECR|nr:hypothetical protein L596_005209 [Steinernema carpocapsae]
MLAAEFTILMRFRKYRYLDFMLTEGNTLWYILPWITNGLHYYLKAVIYMGNILLSFNRFTSAFYPMHYEPVGVLSDDGPRRWFSVFQFWASKQMVVVRVLAWILPLAAVLPIVLNFHNYNMNFSMGTNNETVRLGGDDTSTQLLSYVDGSLTLAATVICLIFYIATAISISRKMMKHGMQQKQAVEIRLFISSFFIFAVLTLNAISQVWTIIASKRGDTVIVMWLNDLSYPLLDVMYSANPWILCATSSAIRDVLLRIFLPFRFTGSRIRVVPTTSAISTIR